jgi:hypothetical protein
MNFQHLCYACEAQRRARRVTLLTAPGKAMVGTIERVLAGEGALYLF